MTKKNEKRLCWNCEGAISPHLTQCPYCGVELSEYPIGAGDLSRHHMGSPFQSSPQNSIPVPPYANLSGNFAVSEEEWNQTMEKEGESIKKEETPHVTMTKKEMGALLLLFPGIIFLLFGLLLIFFSQDGVLSLEWNEHFAYYYFIGAAPLLFLGWRAFR